MVIFFSFWNLSSMEYYAAILPKLDWQKERFWHNKLPQKKWESPDIQWIDISHSQVLVVLIYRTLFNKKEKKYIDNENKYSNSQYPVSK